MPPEPLCWPILGLCWPSAVYVGGMFAHLGVMLGLCCHILARFWTMLWAMLDRRVPPEVIWSYVVFMTSLHSQNFAWKSSPQWPARHPLHFCNTISLKKLNPAGDGCKIEGSHQWPARFQETLPRGSEEGSAAPGGFPVAEAKVQATTSLTLHGMAGLCGLRPAPAMPGEEMGREGSRTRIL